jgi:pimeloyl-ACP methyl ester carboxylesterase
MGEDRSSTVIADRSEDRFASSIERHGSGPPVVYVHGFLGEGATSPGLAALAERGFEILRIRLPGFGGMEELESIDDFDDLCFWLDDALSALGIDRFDLIGSCFGGWVVAEYAVRNPHRMRSIVVTSAPGLAAEGAKPAEFFGVPFDKMADLLFYDSTQPMAQVLKMAGAGGSRVPLANPEAVLPFLRALAAVARFSWNPYFCDPKLSGRLKRLGCRALVVWGAKDAFLPLEIGRLWERHLPASELVVLEDCGHYPVLEKPQQWAEAVAKFLSGV